jgi:hypothetical protein
MNNPTRFVAASRPINDTIIEQLKNIIVAYEWNKIAVVEELSECLVRHRCLLLMNISMAVRALDKILCGPDKFILLLCAFQRNDGRATFTCAEFRGEMSKQGCVKEAMVVAAVRYTAYLQCSCKSAYLAGLMTVLVTTERHGVEQE